VRIGTYLAVGRVTFLFFRRGFKGDIMLVLVDYTVGRHTYVLERREPIYIGRLLLVTAILISLRWGEWPQRNINDREG